jgi:hypothetical protein
MHIVADVIRTSMNLDRDKVRAAADVLGTTGTTETVHAALDEVVAIRSRRRIFKYFPPTTLEELHRWRAETAEEDMNPDGTG